MSLADELKLLSGQGVKRNEYVRAPMGYPGSKSSSIKELLGILPYRNAFIDVCGGSGAVLLARKQSKLDVFNDRNAGIVALYRCARDPIKLKELLKRLELAPPLSREEFLWTRDNWHNPALDDVERAARYYYALSYSFSTKGLQFGRVTRRDGRSQSLRYFTGLDLFGPLHNRLVGTTIENLDWKQILTDYKVGGKDVVWYIDPPYWNVYKVYEHEWAEEDHRALCHRVQDLDGGYVAVSGYDHPDHPYNKFKFWTNKFQWEVNVKMTALAFTEENNLLAYKDVLKRSTAMETLWVYDPS